MKDAALSSLQDRRSERRLLNDSLWVRLLAVAAGSLTARLIIAVPDSLTGRVLEAAGTVGAFASVVLILALLLVLVDAVAGPRPQTWPGLRVWPMAALGMSYLYLSGASALVPVSSGTIELALYYFVVGVLCVLSGASAGYNMARACTARRKEVKP